MAQNDTLTSKRLNAQWQIAATLNMGSASNSLLTVLKTQPDGAYAEADMNEVEKWLKWQIGQDASMAKWFPKAVYTGIVSKIENFAYGSPDIGASYKPPTNAAGGVGQCTCSSDSVLSRDVLCFKWDYANFTEQAAGAEAEGTWTFSGLAAGLYVLVFDDYSTNESFPTTYLTVTES